RTSMEDGWQESNRRWLVARAGRVVRARYSMTSVACNRSVGGIVRPRAFAVLRLITSSNFVDFHHEYLHKLQLGKGPGVLSKKKRGHDYHVKGSPPVNIDGRRKAQMAQNDQPIAERDENCNGEEYCSGALVSPPKKQQDYETGKDVTNSLDPHKRKGGGIVDWDAVGS